MSCSRKLALASFLQLLIIAIPSLTFSQVFHTPNPKDILIERWGWAVQEAGKQKLKHGFWIGYSIKRLMGERQSVYSTDEHTISSTHLPNYLKSDSLEKIL